MVSWAVATAVGLLAVAAAVNGCSSVATETDPCPEDPGIAIGTSCDLIVPQMCLRSVEVCGEPGTVDECVERARTKCCQGGCGRLTCAPDARKLLQCVRAYVGPDAGIDATIDEPLAPPSQAISCAEVLEGYAPPECVEIVQLK